MTCCVLHCMTHPDRSRCPCQRRPILQWRLLRRKTATCGNKERTDVFHLPFPKALWKHMSSASSKTPAGCVSKDRREELVESSFRKKSPVLTVLEAKKKPLRTLKRRSRGNAAAGKKARQGRQSGAKGRKRKIASETMPKETDRKPRAKKMLSAAGIKPTETKKAYAELKKAGWLWQPKHCDCGGVITLQPYDAAKHRGKNRCFYRCSDCEG